MSQNTSHAVMAQRAEPHEIVTLSEARARGLLWYFTGFPCPKGHIGKRSVSNRECRGCVDARAAAKRERNPDACRERDRQRYHRNIEAKREQMRRSRIAHAEARRQYDRQRYHTDPARQHWQKQQAGSWWKINRGKKNFMTARRRAWVKQATPPWLTEQHWEEIRQIYIRAKAMPMPCHVDHIVPLRGRGVCGLHVPWNLQIIPASVNIKKSNLLDYEGARP